MRFKLDFTLNTSKERLNYIKTNIDFNQLTKKDIELCTDYVLYGKEPDKNNTSLVDRKEIYIKTKYSSWSKQEPCSLEELMETPNFDETVFKKEKNIYRKPKPSIDREKCKDIPGMKELWEQIDQLNRKIQLFEKKIEPEPNEQVPNYTSKELYHLKHLLIELRKEQYMLKDIAYPELVAAKNYGIFYQEEADFQTNYPVFPCGIINNSDEEFFKNPYKNGIEFKAFDLEKEIERLDQNKRPYFNFLNKEHIYHLCLNYYEIKDLADRTPNSPLQGLLKTLDFYIDKANLSEQQKLIVDGKKHKLLNKEICKILNEKLGINHQENYISTIWNKACQSIANAAELHFDEWCCKDYEPAWKKCKCCNQFLLRDLRNFVKKTKASDGLTNRCKRCDQKKRRGEI